MSARPQREKKPITTLASNQGRNAAKAAALAAARAAARPKKPKTAVRPGVEKPKRNLEAKNAQSRVMTTPTQPQCGVDGSEMYYKINDIRNVTENKVVKSGFEMKFLIDTVKAIRGQCFNVHQQCKGLYPIVDGREAGKKWLTSIDQDNDISLQHTLDKSDIPILYNTPRFCDPGIVKSKNWSLKNYITTRLFMYKNALKNGSDKFTNLNRNSNNCYDSIVFDFRPFTFSMELPGESNAITRTNTPAKKIYITQWMEFNPKSEFGFSPNTAISDKPYTPPNVKSTRDFFKELVRYYSQRGKFGKEVSPSEFNNSKPVQIGNTNKDIEDFISFIKKYDGVGFAGANNNSNGVLPVSNARKGILNLKLEDDIIRMFFFDLIHDLGKTSAKFKSLTYGQFKRRFVAAVDELKGEHRVSGFKTGAGTTAKSYEQYETLVQKRNITDVNEVPAIFKTLGDLTQYIYAAKYNTTVASGDRMGIAVGLYACAKMGYPVKTMIEDGITGFVLYTGRKEIKFSRGSVCRRGGNTSGVCIRNAKTSVSGNTIANNLQVPPVIAQQMAIIEARKPKLPSGMKSLVSLWSNSAKVINAEGVDTIMGTIQAFDGYWGEDDLKKFLNIVQTLRERNNITKERSNKLNTLNGRLRGLLPNKGGPSRSGLIRTQSNPKPPNNNTRARNLNATPPNNITRAKNLNAYINNLQRQLGNKGKLNKSIYLSNLNKNNSNVALFNIKARAKANAQRILRPSPQGNVNMSNANNNQRGVKRQRTN
jgi:hypothetical protein